MQIISVEDVNNVMNISQYSTINVDGRVDIHTYIQPHASGSGHWTPRQLAICTHCVQCTYNLGAFEKKRISYSIEKRFGMA